MLKIAADVTKDLPAISDQSAKKRRGSGKPFVPGRSGNPSGRPKRTPEEFDLILAGKAKIPDTLAVIAKLMSTWRIDRVRMDAALAIIERRFGRPVQPTTIGGGDGRPEQAEAIRADWVALCAALAARTKQVR